MGAPKQIGWLVDSDGAVVKYDAAQVVLRSKEDLHARARVGLAWVDMIMKAFGWQCNCIVQSTNSLSFAMGRTAVDVCIRKPQRIAYVTSRPGWEYRRDVVGKSPDITLPDGRVLKGQEIVRPTANIQYADDYIDDPYVLQVISTSEAGESTAPIFIPVNQQMGDPAIAVAKAVLLTFRNLVGADKFVSSGNQPVDVERLVDAASAGLLKAPAEMPASCRT
jgi:hypothetical protein